MKYLPYGRQEIQEDDIAAVNAVLRSDWLTTGPAVDRFEQAVANFTGARYAIAVSSGTAALHSIMHGIGIGNGDEVIVPAMTFAATANAVLYCGGTPVFADVKVSSLLVDPASVAERITDRTRAIIAVDYAGQPCDYDELLAIAAQHGLTLVADACHSLGGRYKDRKIGTLADFNAFSFHPVKNITTAEGGMVTTGNTEAANRIRAFRNHGITTDHRQRESRQAHAYEMVELGFNYRISDLQCALGVTQLAKLPRWLSRREIIAELYTKSLKEVWEVKTLERLPDREHAHHLYVLQLDSRDRIFKNLRENGIGCNVHYIPVYLHPYYQDRLGYRPGLCPVAESAYERILSIPIFPQMEDSDVARVVDCLRAAVRE